MENKKLKNNLIKKLEKNKKEILKKTLSTKQSENIIREYINDIVSTDENIYKELLDVANDWVKKENKKEIISDALYVHRHVDEFSNYDELENYLYLQWGDKIEEMTGEDAASIADAIESKIEYKENKEE